MLFYDDISQMNEAAQFIENVLFQNVFGNFYYGPTLYNRSE